MCLSVSAAVVNRVGQLYDFYVNMWQFASCPQGIAALPEGQKDASGAPVEGDRQGGTLTQQEQELQLPKFVHPAVSRQLGSGDTQQPASANCNAAGVAQRQEIGLEPKGP